MGCDPGPGLLWRSVPSLCFLDLESIQAAFPHLDPSIINDDLAYPAMLKKVLPHGWLGLVLASLTAAYMSTISTHLNWGSSYVVNDFYKRFVKPEAAEKELVRVGRISTVLMMVVAGFIALQLSNALQAFEIMLQIGAGTGLLFILRWFWWRINAISEMVAMAVSFVLAVFFKTVELGLESWQQLIIGVGITTVCWIVATLLTRPSDSEILKSFCLKVNPGGPGWKQVYAELAAENKTPVDSAIHLPTAILCMVLGCAAVYGALFATGFWLYGNTGPAIILTTTAVVSVILLLKIWKKS